VFFRIGDIKGLYDFLCAFGNHFRVRFLLGVGLLGESWKYYHSKT
jgi:hypothetical protein